MMEMAIMRFKEEAFPFRGKFSTLKIFTSCSASAAQKTEPNCTEGEGEDIWLLSQQTGKLALILRKAEQQISPNVTVWATLLITVCFVELLQGFTSLGNCTKNCVLLGIQIVQVRSQSNEPLNMQKSKQQQEQSHIHRQSKPAVSQRMHSGGKRKIKRVPQCTYNIIKTKDKMLTLANRDTESDTNPTAKMTTNNYVCNSCEPELLPSKDKTSSLTAESDHSPPVMRVVHFHR